MATVLQMIFLNVLFWMEMFVFWFKFYWNLFEGSNSQQIIICSSNGLLPWRKQAITWTNVDKDSCRVIVLHWIKIAWARDKMKGEIQHLKPTPDSKVHGANMGPTWVLPAPDGPHVGSMDLAIRDVIVVVGECVSLQRKARTQQLG